MKKYRGATLLELSVAVFLLGLAVYGAGNLLAHAANASARQVARAESFENVRVSLDFLVSQAQAAHKITYTTRRNTGELNRMDLHASEAGGHVYIFVFDGLAGRLNFGGSSNYPFTAGTNELASGLKEIKIFHDVENELLVFTATSGDGEYSLSAAADVRYKKIN